MVASRTSFLATDVQFSVVAVLTDLGHLSERVAYSPYGRAEHRWADDVNADATWTTPDPSLTVGAR